MVIKNEIVEMYKFTLTQKGGYEGKKMLAGLQCMMLDKKDTDCGSTHYLKLTLTKQLKPYFLYRYIKKGNKLELLTPENIDSYVDTIINLRSPMYCKCKNKFCNKCAGEFYYMIGVENIGLTANKPSSIALNNSLKQFHDQSLHTMQLDWKKYFK